MITELTTFAELEAQKAENLTAFSGIKLLHIKRSIAELLGQIGSNGIFDQYTRHDISHIDAMLQMLDWIVPRDQKNTLTQADWLMVVLSIYFHDLGMLVTKDEFSNRNESSFREFCEINLFGGDQGIDYKEKIEKLPFHERDRFLYQEFVRFKHAERIRYWIMGQARTNLGINPQIITEIDKLLEHLDPIFRRDLANICESHHLDDIADYNKYKLRQPYGQDFNELVNLQYCAILLRTADLLHVTRDRTPSLAFRILNPADPVSQQEWAKQMAVRSVRSQLGRTKDGNVSPTAAQDTIEIFAHFKSPDGFFGLTSYLAYAESQIRKNHDWIENSRRSQGVEVSFPWRYIDTQHIETAGFLSQTFEFTIDQAKILDLLTGHTLYNDAKVVLRELAQNAIDAVRLQSSLEGKSSLDVGRILIHWDSRERILTVEDNGTGMSQEIIENHLLKVGSSRYQDPDFKKRHPNFCSISRFGIGILSAFMIADSVEILTCHPDEESARRLSLKSVHGRYLISLIDKTDPVVKGLGRHGTRVRLHVRPSAKFEDPETIAKSWIVIPNCQVTYSIDSSPPISIGFISPKLALEALLQTDGLTLLKNESKPKDGDIRVFELENNAAGVALAFAVEWSSLFKEWKFLEIISDRRLWDEENNNAEDDDGSPGVCFCVEGVRVKSGTPGFTGKKIYAIANAVGPKAPRTNVARSALEDTPELSLILETIYKLFCEHVKNELALLQSDRGFSLTWAVQEAGYLLDLLFNQHRSLLTNRALALKAAASVAPFVLIEEANVRKSISLDEFRKCPRFWTIHGELFLAAEDLLRQVAGRGSLSSIIAAMSNNGIILPNGPVLCGNGSLNPIWDLAFEGMEPVRFEFDYSQRRLNVLWEPIKMPPRWIKMPKTSQLIDNREYYNEGGNEVSFLQDTWVGTGLVETVSLDDEEIVKVGGQKFVLPKTKLAAFLVEVHAISLGKLNIKEKRNLFRFVRCFEASIQKKDGHRAMRRYYENESNEITSSITLDQCLEALKSTEGKVFDPSAWSRKIDEDEM